MILGLFTVCRLSGQVRMRAAVHFMAGLLCLPTTIADHRPVTFDFVFDKDEQA